MFRKLKIGASVVAVLAAGLLVLPGLALADVGSPNPSGLGVISDIKTKPLAESDTIIIPINIHNDENISNWAGYKLKVHVLDGNESSLGPDNTVDFTLDSNFVPDGNFSFVPADHPQSIAGQSKNVTKWWFDPGAPSSGKNLPSSQNVPIAKIELHAKNTDPANNSDVDVTVMAWNIIHLQGGVETNYGASEVSVWAPSTWNPGTNHVSTGNPNPNIPQASSFTNITLTGGTTIPYHLQTSDLILPTPPTGPNPDPNWQWKHVPFTWHAIPGTGSNFLAILAGTALIGIEHVPEPASGLALAGGIGCLLVGALVRRKRRRNA